MCTFENGIAVEYLKRVHFLPSDTLLYLKMFQANKLVAVSRCSCVGAREVRPFPRGVHQELVGRMPPAGVGKGDPSPVGQRELLPWAEA